MKTVISTASLFTRYLTEDALEFLSKNNIETAEVFLESYREYNKAFGEFLRGKKGNIEINSVHTLTTQFEPQLYSLNERAKEDSFELLKGTMECAKSLGAKYYTFHGQARFKVTHKSTDYDRVGKITQEIIDTISPYGVTLAFENVHWCAYNHVGFFSEIKKRTKGLKATLDIKQARQAGIDYNALIDEMGEDIVTVHLSDINENGKMCLPGKGVTDFEHLLKRLHGVGFDGALILEVYTDDYKKEEELFSSLEYINNLSQKIFK